MPDTFADLIRTANGGSINNQATEEVEKLVQAMHREAQSGGKPKGSLLVKVSMVLHGGAFDTVFSIKRTEPAKVNERIILYGKPDGTLSENDHRQHSLDLSTARDVSTGPAAEVRSITDRRAAVANDQ